MILIKVEKEEEKIKQIILSDHAEYDKYGKDIVCAGVSSILTTTVNAILSFDETSIMIDEGKSFVLTVLKWDEITIKLLQNMLSLFLELQESYPKNIRVREDE